MSEIWNLNTLCRCCHADGNFKSLTLSCQGENDVRSYESMLRESLGISICPSLKASYTLCDKCICTLRDAAAFKNQVLMCEQKLKVYCLNEQFAANLDVLKLEADDNDNGNTDAVNRDVLKFEVDDNGNENTDGYIEFVLDHSIEDIKKEPQLKCEILDDKVTSNVTTDLKSDVPKTTKGKKQNISKNTEERKNRVVLDRSFIIEMKIEAGTQFSCKDCGGLYQTRKDINQHIYKVHPTLFKCEYCPKQLKTFRTYQNHLCLHSENKIQCNLCSKKFPSKQGLNYHLKCHAKDIFKCDMCQKEFKYRQTIIKHLQVHAGTSKKKLCDLCGRSFNDQSNLNAHVRTVHQKLRPYRCKICGKSYTSKRHLRDHLKVHNDDKNLYNCDICDHRLSCQKSMEIHRLKHDNKYMCRYCSEIFDDVLSRKEHVQMKHRARVEEHTCPLCGKVLAGKFSLNRHINDHKGIKKFPCDICGTEFSQKASLNRHIFRKHNPKADINVGKTKCNICKHSFKNIKLHLNSHNNRLCGCEICGKTYPDNSALNRHKLAKHFNRTFDCDVCGKKYLQKSKLNTHKTKVHKIKIEKDTSGGS